MVHTFTSTSVPAGTWYPATVVSSRLYRGISMGTTGWSRIVSLTMDSMKGRFGMSFSSTHRSLPTTRSSSSHAFSKISGLRRISAIAHSTVTAEVSVPPAIMSCRPKIYFLLNRELINLNF
ncbi:unnamed protein product [Spirodela intermedia]|uniref:Uncharacterized protein n=2 Tax=Spirodela intermedia TaxID=51605 RepID=A0A7I8KCZ5_SPIIN|nr:unnamed protein product [Spirodela intermedia]